MTTNKAIKEMLEKNGYGYLDIPANAVDFIVEYCGGYPVPVFIDNNGEEVML